MDDMKWRKSSRSGNGGADCVEIARIPQSIATRDSKKTDGGMLTFSLGEFGVFLAQVKAGKYEI